ncbi:MULTISPECIES: acyltransferase [Delftia]|jgi:galactoside O-acetyltransferase|uniref:Chloramphenicol acetyltransferase n=1 Tax=Delftia acidovorans TaxID=80866 RepID=A0AAJ2R0N4_DELAC|nr:MULTISPECIES: acyltransferase [Delftia]KZK25767.1 O-acetyltransferase [Delftia sp. GW456-R20]MDX4955521.1 acyltransferase [Delftia acidovorans]
MAFLSKDQLISMGFKYLGDNVRISDKAAIYNPELIEIGDNSRIDDFCVLSGRVIIGRNVHIAVFNNIAGGEPGVYLADFSGVAYGCQIFSQSDDYSGRSLTNPTVPDEYKTEIKAAVFLGRHVIIGASSIVLPGVIIEEGCSVGAMSMVTKSTEAWSIYFGIPAKKIKDRKKDLLELEKKYLDSE